MDTQTVTCDVQQEQWFETVMRYRRSKMTQRALSREFNDSNRGRCSLHSIYKPKFALIFFHHECSSLWVKTTCKVQLGLHIHIGFSWQKLPK